MPELLEQQRGGQACSVLTLLTASMEMIQLWMVGVTPTPLPQHPPEHLVGMLLNGKHSRDAYPRLQSGTLCPFPAVGFFCPVLPFLPWRRIALGLPTVVGFPEKWSFGPFGAGGGLGPNLQPPLCVILRCFCRKSPASTCSRAWERK